jgi:hypothetical protein
VSCVQLFIGAISREAEIFSDAIPLRPQGIPVSFLYEMSPTAALISPCCRVGYNVSWLSYASSSPTRLPKPRPNYFGIVMLSGTAQWVCARQKGPSG